MESNRKGNHSNVPDFSKRRTKHGHLLNFSWTWFSPGISCWIRRKAQDKFINTRNTNRGGVTINQNLALWLVNYNFWKSLLGGHGKSRRIITNRLRTFALIVSVHPYCACNRPFHSLLFWFTLQCIRTWMWGNFGQKLHNCPKLPHIHVQIRKVNCEKGFSRSNVMHRNALNVRCWRNVEIYSAG